MIIYKWLFRSYMYMQFYYHKFTKSGSFGPIRAEYIQNPYKPTGNTLKDGLFKHHVKQYHDSSCSVASIVSVVNALMENAGSLNDTLPGCFPIDQQEILNRVKAAHWKERMGENGYKGRRGLPLSTLGHVVESSLNTYGIKYKQVETVQALGNPEFSSQIKNKLQSRLEQFERNGNCLIISHFDQGSFLPELHIPHISPVGGFNSNTGMVTMLDVDSTQKYPYMIPFDKFYEGLSYNYNNLFRMYGFAEGGYIYIKI